MYVFVIPCRLSEKRAESSIIILYSSNFGSDLLIPPENISSKYSCCPSNLGKPSISPENQTSNIQNKNTRRVFASVQFCNCSVLRMMTVFSIGFFARLDTNTQAILDRRQGTGCKVRVSAGRVIGCVEIHQDFPLLWHLRD